MKIQYLSLAVIFLAVLSLSSCNTVRGMGQDMKKGGEAIKDAAD